MAFEINDGTLQTILEKKNCADNSILKEFNDALRDFQCVINKVVSFGVIEDSIDTEYSHTHYDIVQFKASNDNRRSEINTTNILGCVSANLVIDKSNLHFENNFQPLHDIEESHKEIPVASSINNVNKSIVIGAKFIVANQKRKVTELRANNSNTNHVFTKKCRNTLSPDVTSITFNDTTPAINKIANTTNVSMSYTKTSVSKEKKADAIKILIESPPVILFGGNATIDTFKDSRLYRLMLKEGSFIDQFLKSCEKHLKTSNMKINQHWYRLLELCFKKKEGNMYSWFKQWVHKDLSWCDVKSMIIKRYGYGNSKVETAMLHYINYCQNAVGNQHFQLYFESYRSAVRGVLSMRKNDMLKNFDKQKDEFLILNFIKGTERKMVSTAMFDLLRDLFYTKKHNGTFELSAEEYFREWKEIYRRS